MFDDGNKLPVSGVFVAIGVAGGVDLAKKLGAVVNGNYIDVNDNMQTNIPNLYAVGDCTGGIVTSFKGCL